LARSDLVVIPAQASEPDLREALVVVGDIRDVGDTTGRKIPYRLLLTKVHPLRTRVTDFAYAELARLGLPLFRTALVERSAYREMFLNGQPPTVTEAGKGAGLEIQNLLAEIRAIAADTITEIRKAG
jgi:chromosome partitioning protein